MSDEIELDSKEYVLLGLIPAILGILGYGSIRLVSNNVTVAIDIVLFFGLLVVATCVIVFGLYLLGRLTELVVDGLEQWVGDDG